MERDYKCKLVRATISDDYEEDEVNYHFILEYNTDSVTLRRIANKVLAPKMLTPMEIEGVEYLGNLDESYAAISNDYPVIQVISNHKFRINTKECSLDGEISENELKNNGFNTLEELVRSDVGFELLFVNDALFVEKRILIYIPVSKLLWLR